MTQEEAIEIIKRNCTAGSQLREACKVFIPELFENKDERIRKDIIALIEFGVSKGSVVTPFSSTTKEEALAYLEKKKEQKPAEWSEEDEIELINIIEFLNSPTTAELCPTLRKNAIAWLKSIRPQPHWKPSEEQIKALKNCVNGWQNTADGTLESLYNDLKKL